MRATLVVAAGLFASCGYEHGVYMVPRDDAAPVDTSMPTIDAKPDAPLDAHVCPAAPPGCTRFSCEASTSCYYVCGATAPAKKNWEGARDACAQIGGSTPACLVTVSSQAEQNCIVQQAMPSFPMSNWIWIGYRQPPNTGEPLDGWAWECGASTFIQSPWGTGAEPSQTGEEDCAGITGGGGWFDTNCTDSARYVCELP